MTYVDSRPFVVITGASSGIGYELAREFASQGFDMAIVAEDDGIFDVASDMDALGSAAYPFKIDLAHYEGVDTLMEKLEELDRTVYILAVNAGVGVSGAFNDTSLEAEMNMINLNVISSVHLTKKILPDMLAKKQGKILFTSSIAATSPGPFYAVYAASKAFIQSFAEALREEIKDSGVTVTSLMPGATDTNFFVRAGMENTKAGRGKKDDPALVAKQAFQALMDGDDHVVAGAFTNKVMGVMNKILPETVSAAATRKNTQPRPEPARH